MAKIIHLVCDHDNIGEPVIWCSGDEFSSSDDLSTVTCPDCLAECAAYGIQAAGRLVEVNAANASPAAFPCPASP